MKKKEISEIMTKAKSQLAAMREAEKLSLIRPTSWYLSSEGEKEYDQSKTPMEKTMYFYGYLRSVCYGAWKKGQSSSKAKEYENGSLYKMAFIMAKVVAGSSLPYANYPDILNSKENPLVRFCENDLYDYDYHKMLYELCGVECEEEEEFTPEERAFRHLTYCDGECTDQYKLERYFIWLFLSEGSLDGVYCYDIIDSSRTLDGDENDKKDGFEEEEDEE